MDRVFTAIERAALPKRVVYSDFAAAPAMISDCEVSVSPKQTLETFLAPFPHDSAAFRSTTV